MFASNDPAASESGVTLYKGSRVQLNQPFPGPWQTFFCFFIVILVLFLPEKYTDVYGMGMGMACLLVEVHIVQNCSRKQSHAQ